mgnify:CR=1 FL=1
MGLVDEIVEENELLARAKQIVSGCIDTPNRPFMRMKELLRMDTVSRISRKQKEENWRDGLHCLLTEDVRQTLEFVQASMQ